MKESDRALLEHLDKAAEALHEDGHVLRAQSCRNAAKRMAELIAEAETAYSRGSRDGHDAGWSQSEYLNQDTCPIR